MRYLICGSREFADPKQVDDYIKRLPPLSTIISGGARGVDTWASNAAKRYGHKTLIFPADWKKYGKAAGFVRNKQMIDEGKPDHVVAFWDGESKGTSMMIDFVKKANITMEIHYASRTD